MLNFENSAKQLTKLIILKANLRENSVIKTGQLRDSCFE